jgi:hypothetical protein
MQHSRQCEPITILVVATGNTITYLHYVFYVGVIHVTCGSGRARSLGYRLSVCRCPEANSTFTSRFSLSTCRKGDGTPTYSRLPLCMEAHRDCISAKREPLRKHLRLGLLQTCRQVYHEAVLKPLAVNTFHTCCDCSYFPGQELQCLLNSLVLSQVRAIKHLRLVCGRAIFLRHTTVQQLKGLERLDIGLSVEKPISMVTCGKPWTSSPTRTALRN